MGGSAQKTLGRVPIMFKIPHFIIILLLFLFLVLFLLRRKRQMEIRLHPPNTVAIQILCFQRLPLSTQIINIFASTGSGRVIVAFSRLAPTRLRRVGSDPHSGILFLNVYSEIFLINLGYYKNFVKCYFFFFLRLQYEVFMAKIRNSAYQDLVVRHKRSEQVVIGGWSIMWSCRRAWWIIRISLGVFWYVDIMSWVILLMMY